MTELEKTICWSCGNSPEGCICGREQVLVAVKSPLSPPPSCGTAKLDTDNPQKVEPRACCQCGKTWNCTQHDWIHGTCPHCGAFEADGCGGSGFVKFDTGIGEKTLLKNNFEINLQDPILFYKNPKYSFGEILDTTKDCPKETKGISPYLIKYLDSYLDLEG